MVTVWNDSVGSAFADLQNLDRKQLFALSYKCLSHVYGPSLPRFRRLAAFKFVALLESSVAQLDMVADSGSPIPYLDPVLCQLVEMPPISEMQRDLVPGWEAFVAAIRLAIYIPDPSISDPLSLANESLEQCYLTIAEPILAEIGWMGAGRLSEQDMLVAEIDSPICRREREFQLKCIDGARRSRK